MSFSTLAEGATDPTRVLHSPLESARFGLTVGRLEVPLGTQLRAVDVLDLLGESDDEFVVLRYPAEFVRWAVQLSRPHLRTVPADTLVYFDKPLGPGLPDLDVRTAVEPTGALRALVADAFGGYQNHYAASPLLAPDDVRAGYLEWAESFMRPVSDRCCFYLGGPDPSGFGCLESNDSNAELVLAGTARRFQRQGLYQRILAASEDLAFARGAELLVTSTQVTNRQSINSWIRRGFRYVAAFQTAHVYRGHALDQLLGWLESQPAEGRQPGNRASGRAGPQGAT